MVLYYKHIREKEGIKDMRLVVPAIDLQRVVVLLKRQPDSYEWDDEGNYYHGVYNGLTEKQIRFVGYEKEVKGNG